MDDGRTEGAAAERRRFAARYLSAVVIMAGAGLLTVAQSFVTGTGQVLLSAVALAIMVGGFFWGTFFYMRVIDEQERMANLWASAVGMWLYFTLFALRVLLEALGASPPYGHEEIFVASVAVSFSTFLWRRFR